MWPRPPVFGYPCIRTLDLTLPSSDWVPMYMDLGCDLALQWLGACVHRLKMWLCHPVIGCPCAWTLDATSPSSDRVPICMDLRCDLALQGVFSPRCGKEPSFSHTFQSSGLMKTFHLYVDDGWWDCPPQWESIWLWNSVSTLNFEVHFNF